MPTCRNIILILSLIVLPLNITWAAIDYANTAITLANSLTPQVYGVTTDTNGNIYLIENGSNGYIIRIDKTTLGQTNLEGPGSHSSPIVWHNNWIYYNAGGIKRVTDTGSTVENLFTDGSNSILGLCIDRQDPNTIWYTHQSDSAIRYWNGTSITTVHTSAGNELRSIVQQTDNQLVWTARNDSVIRRSNGVSFSPIVSGITNPRGLACDTTNNLYYEEEYNTSSGYYAINKIYLPAGDTSPPITPAVLIDERFSVRRITVDNWNNLYWSDAATAGSNAHRVCVLPRMESQLFVTPASCNSNDIITVTALATYHGPGVLTNVSPNFPSINMGGDIGSVVLLSGPTPANVVTLTSGDSAAFTWTYRVLTSSGAPGFVSFDTQVQAAGIQAPAVADTLPLLFPQVTSTSITVDAVTQLPEPSFFTTNISSLSTTATTNNNYIALSGTANAWTLTQPSDRARTIEANSLRTTFYVQQIYSEYAGYPQLDIQLSCPGYSDLQTVSFSATSVPGYYQVSFLNPELTIAPGEALTLLLTEVNRRIVEVRYGNNLLSLWATYVSANTSETAINATATPTPISSTPTHTPTITETVTPADTNTFYLSANVFRPLQQEDLLLSFQNNQTGQVSIKVYSVLGKPVRTLLNENRLSGTWNDIGWDGKNQHGDILPAGVYILQMKAPDYSERRKVILIK